ncbi:MULTISPECIES: M60 family metallopeptidase [unclassified Photobacterium]|uniref:M60 family metallopeptidase n=1 Tax=unclassified Photobacterium TaxID=2628852 RepID=UPI001EDEDBDB|nr:MULTISPECIES: M60 family metallopeptidase [unclassified Photobacterium]MCG3865235.1 hypothetical protein [Photobacterium sp. Ph6]MCG3876732.1 hypothetical protein [Photobacterium sp. Ph5]
MNMVTAFSKYLVCVMGLFVSASSFSSEPPIHPIINPDVNENVVDTVTVDPALSKSTLLDSMQDKLRPNRGLTHYIPTKIYVEVGDYIRLSPVYYEYDVQICINTLSTMKLCDQRVRPNYVTDYYVKAAVNGEIYVDNQLRSTDPVVEITITGGNEMPIFRLGEHTDSDFLAMLDDATTPNMHLITEKMIITGPINKLKQYGITNPTELMQSWDNIVTWGQQHYGFSPELASLHQPMSHKLLFLDVGDDGVGSMYATTHHLGTGLDNVFNRVVDTEFLNGTRGWGPWHEYGHTLQPRYLQFPGMTEVTTNITSQKIRQTLGHGSNIVNHWNNNIYPYLDKPNSEKDYFGQELKLFDKLGLFWQLDLTFGPRFYQRMSVIMRNGYRDLPFLFDVREDQRVQVFIREASLATGYDLREYFRYWGIPVSGETNIDLNRYAEYLQPSTGMWNNSDLQVSQPAYEFGQDVAIHYRPQKNKIQFAYDYFRTWQPEHRVKVYINGDYLGKIENNQSDIFDVGLDKESAIVKVSLKKRLDKGDKIKLVFESPLVDTATYKYKVNDIRIRANSEKDKIVVRVSKKRFNRDDFSLKAFTKGNLLFSCENRACDHADVQYKNNKVVITRQPFELAPNQLVYIVVGNSERVIYAK